MIVLTKYYQKFWSKIYYQKSRMLTKNRNFVKELWKAMYVYQYDVNLNFHFRVFPAWRAILFLSYVEHCQKLIFWAIFGLIDELRQFLTTVVKYQVSHLKVICNLGHTSKVIRYLISSTKWSAIKSHKKWSQNEFYFSSDPIFKSSESDPIFKVSKNDPML